MTCRTYISMENPTTWDMESEFSSFPQQVNMCQSQSNWTSMSPTMPPNTKHWVEAKSYKVLNAKQVAKFIQNDIICRYGVPNEFISDRGTHFQAETELILKKYKIKHHKSSPYRPQTNGAVKAANKTIATILRKMTDNYREWPEKIPSALWGYKTSIRTATGATPYYLVYGMEAVQPVELEIPSLRILLESEVPEADWVQARYDSLLMLDERHLNALYHIQLYQKRIERAFNKKGQTPRNQRRRFGLEIRACIVAGRPEG
ncbi:uncharacterized protein LOC141618948 [Silene latifolia]|uniref:uncharacterized protein LOC141618948 n=1 Tax=Silene latifolia TaxID=37657 RepID=UPI003D78285B